MEEEEEPKKPSNHYFDNDKVEKLLIKYHERGCTDVELRDEIMSHSTLLIINVIRTHNLHTIYGGKEESTFNDLFQMAWQQIESALYKFNAGPNHPKVFNFWSQIARTNILAAIKKNNRDKKNSDNYKLYLDSRVIDKNIQFDRFLEEAREIFKYCDDFVEIIDSLEKLYMEDDRPHEGLISKLTETSGHSRPKIMKFIKVLRIFCGELTDSPTFENDEMIIKPSMMPFYKDED